MYDDSLIGQWVMRDGRKRHLAQTIINGVIRPKCGARLSAKGWEAERPAKASKIMSLVCKRCL